MTGEGTFIYELWNGGVTFAEETNMNKRSPQSMKIGIFREARVERDRNGHVSKEITSNEER